MITRIASTIGLSSAAFNVVNFLFSAKTTALATDQFSAPPTPPTLIDTAARWDGSQYKLMPMPEESAEKGASDKRKRSLERRSSHRLLKRGISEATRVASDDPKMAKRWVVSSIVGAGLGAAFSPGFTSALMNKKADVDAPPFDPYDPNMIKPKDPFVAAAATTDQPLPALQMSDSRTRSRSSTPPVLGDVVFPEQTTAARGQDRGSSRSNLAIDRSSSSSSDTSESTNSGDTTPVLRKRSLESNSELKKRFFFSGGSWGKVSGALTVGSVVPLIYSGVSHARWRTYNPRDRDILKDLDGTPTYGAVGVPGRQPGQLATNAMPGYRNYVAQLEQQQAQTRRRHLSRTQSTPRDRCQSVKRRTLLLMTMALVLEAMLILSFVVVMSIAMTMPCREARQSASGWRSCCLWIGFGLRSVCNSVPDGPGRGERRQKAQDEEGTAGDDGPAATASNDARWSGFSWRV